MIENLLNKTDYQEAKKVSIGEISLTDNLFDKLFHYYVDEMPYGTQKARTGDPYEWITQKLKKEILN